MLEKAMGAMDKIDTDKIGAGLGKFAAKVEKTFNSGQEKFDDFLDGAGEFFGDFQDKAAQIMSDIEDKAIEVAEQETDDWMDKAESMSQSEKELRKNRFERLLNYFKPRYSEYFTNVLANLINEQLDNKLYLTDDMFVVVIEMMLSQAVTKYTEKEDIEIVIIRKILLILGTVALYEGTDTKKQLIEMQLILDASNEEVDKKMIDININGYKAGFEKLNSYQIKVATLEAKYIGVFKYSETLIPFFDLLINLYENESGYTVEMPFDNISKAFELGVLENEDYMSILKDSVACLAYINESESKKVAKDNINQPSNETPIEVSNDISDKPFHHIVKMYNDYFEMNSFLKGSQDNNSTTSKYYMTCSPMNEDMQPDLTSEYLIHSKTGNMITYNLVGNFLVRMESVIASQESSIVKCSKELLDKFGNTGILIAKINDYYCGLPIVSKTDDYHQDGDAFTASLADQSIISINPFTSEILEYSLNSEIMSDILEQIKEIKEKSLKQF